MHYENSLTILLKEMSLLVEECKDIIYNGSKLGESKDLIKVTNDVIDKFTSFNNICPFSIMDITDISNQISDILVGIIEEFNKESNSSYNKLLLYYSELFNRYVEWIGQVQKFIDLHIFYNTIILHCTVIKNNRPITMVQFLDVSIIKNIGSVFKQNNSYKIISFNEIVNLKFEFITIYSDFYEEIKLQLLQKGISTSKILPMVTGIEKYDFFNLDYRLKLINDDFSLIADDCWGGYVYKQLGLEYNTPFMWLYLDGMGGTKRDCLKLLKNLNYYLNLDLSFTKINEINHPVGLLDDVKLYFNHYKSEDEAAKNWARRLQRFNWNNVYIKMTIQNREDAIEFDNLNFKNKVAFTDQDFNLKSCVYMSEWQDKSVQERYEGFWQYVHIESNKYFDFVRWFNNELS